LTAYVEALDTLYPYPFDRPYPFLYIHRLPRRSAICLSVVGARPLDPPVDGACPSAAASRPYRRHARHREYFSLVPFVFTRAAPDRFEIAIPKRSRPKASARFLAD
jgi:hypothetical protein